MEVKATSFSDPAAALAPYNVADLLATVGALQLLPQNASRVTRLEALSHVIASRSAAKAKPVLRHNSKRTEK